MTAEQQQPSPVSPTTLTQLLAALREQHHGAPTVAPLITRAAHPAFRRPVPSAVAEAVRRARAATAVVDGGHPGVPPAGAARRRPAPARPVVPKNLGAVLGAAPGTGNRNTPAARHTQQ